MPEGDTIFKVAMLLRPILSDQVIAEAEVPRHPSIQLTGRRVDGVVARGKHLFIRFEDGERLRIHLGMHGSWHRYPVGAQRWRRPRRLACLRIVVGSVELVCFSPKEIELVRDGGVRSKRFDQYLGPDLCQEGVDVAPVARRVQRFRDADSRLVDVLLDQRVAAGIGNVFKSEVLFLERMDPRAAVSSISPEEFLALYQRAHELLVLNLNHGPRRTRFADTRGPRENTKADGSDRESSRPPFGSPENRLWVYGRERQPCLRCTGRVQRGRIGSPPRATFWCPSCQSPT